MKNLKSGPACLVPIGHIVARSWLRSKGVERHTLDNWVKSGQLVAVARGVFERPETELTWQGVVSSLQHMDIDLTPGGLTALTLQGMAHYISPAELNRIDLYGDDELPAWANTLIPGIQFVRHAALKFDKTENNSHPRMDLVTWKTELLPFGHNKWPLQISSSELAILEVLLDVPKRVSFEHASNLLQGMPTLSPQRVTHLLERCKSVKAKRLLLWLAERNGSPWLKQIDAKKYSLAGGTLGSGKRVVAEGGRLDPKYLITVPTDMCGDANG